MNYWIQPRHQFKLVIALAEGAESLSLGSKYVREGLGTVAFVKLHGEGMGVERVSRDPLVLAGGNFKYRCKVILQL